MLRRSHTCGELNLEALGKSVTLCGWVHRRRDHGGLIFFDLRDRWGLTQVVFNPTEDVPLEKGLAPLEKGLAPLEKGLGPLRERVKNLRPEFCIAIQGQVAQRPKGTENPKLATGMIEVKVQRLEILNESITPPFEIDVERGLSEELRYKYRYLDLRKESQIRSLKLRHQVLRVIRNVLDAEEFLEVETPILTKSTPEGARDYLVPSRLNPGQFYALPQSPQLYKQLLMVSGLDRYYQIARCFRDEDLRADRQPEFTQLDLEMSFVDEGTIFALMEKLFQAIWKEVLHQELKVPFLRMTYAECMERFGTDKPDLRYEMHLMDLTQDFSKTSFQRFRKVLDAGGVLKALVVPGGDSLSGKAVDQLTEIARENGAKGLVTIRVTENGLQSPFAKHLEEKLLSDAVSRTKAKVGDLILLVADEPMRAASVLGVLRVHLADQLKLVPEGKFLFVWVHGFPLFQYNPEEKRWNSEHHPFTAPVEEDLPRLTKDPGSVRARSYDLVVNGVELGSGSIRIHNREIQQAIFQTLGFPEKEIRERFGFLLEAFRFGAPPHGGIAPGIDRLIALIAGTSSIRDVMAFPKTQKGIDLMMGAPSPVDPKQLKELGIRLEIPKPVRTVVSK